jgi:hypothetical protein
MFKMHTFSPDNIKLIVNIILLKKIFPVIMEKVEFRRENTLKTKNSYTSF